MPEDRVAKLAGKDGVTVYKHTHDKPEGTMAAKDQVMAYRDLCKNFDAGCRRLPLASNEALREMIMDDMPILRTFQRLYPMTFATSTIRVINAESELELEKARKLFMAFLVERWQGEGSEAEKEARAMTIATRVAMRPTTEADRKGPLTTRLDDHPEAASLPTLTPLDIKTFGGQVIHQS